jgi:hypothetical protein
VSENPRFHVADNRNESVGVASATITARITMAHTLLDVARMFDS